MAKKKNVNIEEAVAENVMPQAEPAEAPAEKAVTDEEMLELFKAADPQAKEAAISMLKGEKPQGGDMMSMFAGMMGGAGAEGAEGAQGEGGANPMAAMMQMFGGMMGGAGAGNAPEEKPEKDAE